MNKEQLVRDILDAIGDPGVLAKQAAIFEASIREWNANVETYRRKYLGKWVALHDGEVRATADSLDALLEQVDRLGLARGTVFIQHPVADEPTLIL
jgi:hypothetical protein